MGPRFGLPSGPPSLGTVYIPNGKILNGIQATAGLTLYLGHRGEAPAPVVLPRRRHRRRRRRPRQLIRARSAPARPPFVRATR